MATWDLVSKISSRLSHRWKRIIDRINRLRDKTFLIQPLKRIYVISRATSVNANIKESRRMEKYICGAAR